jgi:cytoskeleton protein RodZ
MTDELAAPDVAPSVGAEVGAELARARAARSLSIADIAQQLKFAPRQIEAMEAGRFEDLPAGTFARGMVRAYARLLKLDPEPLVGRMAARVAVPDNAEAVASVRRPIPITDSAHRTNLIYAALSVAFLAVIAGVAFEWQRERSGAGTLTFVEAAKAPAASAPATAPVESTAVASMVTPQIGAAASEPRAPAADAVPPPDEGKRRLQLRFERESWVQIRGRDGKLLTSELNSAGSERIVDGRPPFELVIGNAQYVRLSYDEREINLAPHVKVEVARFTLD